MSLSLIVPIVLVIAGLLFEVLGVFIMAKRSIRIVPFYELPLLMLSALFRGKAALAAVEVKDLNQEDKLSELQGLAFLGLGFFMQTGGFLWSAWS
jgi:hypothetical protein